MQNSNLNKGQSLIEFGLSLIIILIVIFGIFNVGRLFWVKIVITNAAREGARFLIAHPRDREGGFIETKEVAIQEANNSGYLLEESDIEIYCDPDPSDSDFCEVGEPASVKVIKQLDIGILDIFGMGPTITLDETAKMMVP